MTARRTTRKRVELFEASLATGIGQALAGWAAEYTHDLLERNPDLRSRLRANWMAMFEHLARGMDESTNAKPAARRR
jgi:hypothetical protein